MRYIQLLSIPMLLATLLITAPTRSASDPRPNTGASTPTSSTFPGTAWVKFTKLGGYDTHSYAIAVKAVGNLAYVVDRTAGLYVIDVSNPVTPTLYAAYSSLSACFRLQVVGAVAYLACRNGDNGDVLQLVDISDPRNAVVVGSYTASTIVGLHVVGDYAYVGTHGFVLILDVRDPRHPTLRGRVDLDYLPGTAISVVGSRAYIAAQDYVIIADVTDPNSPVVLSRTPYMYGGLTGHARAIAVKDGLAYVAFGKSSSKGLETAAELEIINVSDPHHLRSSGKFVSSSVAPKAVDILGSLAYLGSAGDGRVEVVDVGEPAALRVVSTYAEGLTGVEDLQVVGNRLYVADRETGLQILEMQVVYKVFLPQVVP